MGFGKIVCECMKWSELLQNMALVNIMMNILVPYEHGNFSATE
jgi:hypothetical protein